MVWSVLQAGDNLPWSALSEPALTTVAPNPEQIGHVITEQVVAGLAGTVLEPVRISSGFISLIVRDSA